MAWSEIPGFGKVVEFVRAQGDDDRSGAGLTYSDDFPTTADAYDDSQSGYTDASVARLRLQSRGQEDLVYATFLGGYGSDHGLGIALESRGVVWVAGETDSSDFPTTSGVFDRYYNGGDYDGFIVKMAVPPASDLSTSAKVVKPDTAMVGEVVTCTVRRTGGSSPGPGM